MLKNEAKSTNEYVFHGHYVNEEEEAKVTHGWQARQLEAREDKEITVSKAGALVTVLKALLTMTL